MHLHRCTYTPPSGLGTRATPTPTPTGVGTRAPPIIAAMPVLAKSALKLTLPWLTMADTDALATSSVVCLELSKSKGRALSCAAARTTEGAAPSVKVYSGPSETFVQVIP